MARKGLPRKYAKMGFKRGWAAYKRTKRPARAAPARRKTYRRKPTMARRRSYRKVYRKARSGGGSYKPIIDGVLAGAAGGFASNYLGGYGQPIATLGIGYFRNNTTLKTLGAMQVGALLASNFGGGGGGIGFRGQ